jgi:ribonuclease D
MPPVQGPTEYVWVGNDAELATAAHAWAGVSAVALDTEFVRTRTFYPRLGLIQIAAPGSCWLVDPLSVGDLSPVARLLDDPGTLKVVHSGSEDIEVFFRALGVIPSPLLDTQIAAALSGLGSSMSYQRMVGDLFGVELAKNETRTDWLARPLSAAQRQYAAEDVTFLLAATDRLRADLLAKGRLDWAMNDSKAILDPSRFDVDPDHAFLRIRGAGNFDRRQLAVCRALAAWREGEARRRDLPRGFVLRDELLLKLAIRHPTTEEEVRLLAGTELGQAKRDGATWVTLIAGALALPESELPERLWRLPTQAPVRNLEKALRERVRVVAEGLAVAPETLAPRRLLDALMRKALEQPVPKPLVLPSGLDGWRREVIGEPLLAEVRAAGL